MGTKIHNLIFYPVLENCKFWGVTLTPEQLARSLPVHVYI